MTRPVTQMADITLQATYAGVTRAATLRVTPAPRPAVASLEVSPASVVGGGSPVATLTLTAPAPAGAHPSVRSRL